MCRSRRITVGHLKHRDCFNGCLFRQTELLAYSCHGIYRIIEVDFHQCLQFGDAISKLSEELIKCRVKVRNLGLMSVINCDTATNMDWMLSADKKCRDLCGCDTGVRRDKSNTRHQFGCHCSFARSSQRLEVGSEQIFLLSGHRPGCTDYGMIAEALFKTVSGEPYVKLCLQRSKQLIDREDGVIHTVTGVNCADLFISDQYDCRCWTYSRIPGADLSRRHYQPQNPPDGKHQR